MSWTYEQHSGYLLDSEQQRVATDYSEAPAAKNDPSKQDITKVKPTMLPLSE